MDTLSGMIGGILGTASSLVIVYLFFVGFRKISFKKTPQKEYRSTGESKKIVISVTLPDQARGKQLYNVDLSTMERKGKVIIHAIPRRQQIFVTQYGVSIDDSDLIKISDDCDAVFTLDEGTHTLEICSLVNKLKGIYGDTFGKPSKIQISLSEQKTMEFEYIGPFWMLGSGKLKKSVEK